MHRIPLCLEQADCSVPFKSFHSPFCYCRTLYYHCAWQRWGKRQKTLYVMVSASLHAACVLQWGIKRWCDSISSSSDNTNSFRALLAGWQSFVLSVNSFSLCLLKLAMPFQQLDTGRTSAALGPWMAKSPRLSHITCVEMQSLTPLLAQNDMLPNGFPA